MKNFNKLLLVIIALMISSVAFAVKDKTMNITFINQTFSAGSPVLTDFASIMLTGPKMAKGGSAQMSPAFPDDTLLAAGIMYPIGQGYACTQDEGRGVLALNPDIYKGDNIIIILTTDSEGKLACTCSGSACDVSLSHVRKKL